MDFQSVKTRFMGSYIFLLALFILQVPIIYYLVGGMSQKYSQVEEAGSLRKRAVELTEILNRHILSGDDSLEREFVSKRQEYSKVIEDLKNGTKEFAAIKDAEELDRLAAVEREWGGMQPVFDKALSAGERLRKAKSDVEGSTFPMVEILNRLANSNGGKASNAAALDRMRTVKLSYLLERYLVSFSDRDIVSTDIKAAITEFDESIQELKGTGSAYAGDAEGLWSERKERVLEGVAANDIYYQELHALVDVHTPRIVAAANELTREITRQARNSALKGIGIMVLSVIVSACFTGFFMWLANNHLVKPIEKIKEAIEGLAKGDLTRRADVKVSFLGKEFNDEVASLGESVDTMAEQMSGVIGNMTGSSQRFVSASAQLSASSARIYEGVDTQSKETAQAATAMEEMNATVVEVAKNSQEATETAQKTREIAQKGGLVVSEAITAMTDVAEATAGTAEKIKKLGKSSEEIGTIISAITDIADQTNLLALNAAIEAARAGEHGRGFAVVADEVMKLADRTAKATKEISQMINSIQEETAKAVDAMSEGTAKVENGVKLANEAGHALEEIVEGVENVTNMIGQIATSAEQQSAATDEITRNMDAVSEASRSNVASVNEVAGAAGRA